MRDALRNYYVNLRDSCHIHARHMRGQVLSFKAVGLTSNALRANSLVLFAAPCFASPTWQTTTLVSFSRPGKLMQGRVLVRRILQ